VFFGLAMTPALGVGLYFKTGGVEAVLKAMIVSLFIGGGMILLKPKTNFNDIYPREGFFIVVATWFLCSLFGALPFWFDHTFLNADVAHPLLNKIYSAADSVFESTSGLTTTGASVMSDFEQPHAIMFWRATLHWLGGMGIIVLSLAILPLIGAGGMQLFKAEVPGPVKDRLKPRIADTTITLSKVYVALTAAQVVALWLCGMSWYESVCHTFATMATGGFSTHPLSVGGYDSHAVNLVITLFMILAGCNFAWHYRFVKGEWGVYFKNGEFKVFVGLIVLATMILTAVVYLGGNHETVGDAAVHSVFQSVSILTTTGFATSNFEAWPPLGQMVLFFLMFVGGCAGSTGGGLKVIRIILLAKMAYRELLRLVYPTAVIVVKQDGNPVPDKVLWAIGGFFILSCFLVIVSSLVLAGFGSDYVTSLTATVACLFNIGPGLGDVGPYDNFAGFSPIVKIWLAFLMVVGRLEVYSVLVLLSPSFWRK